jgi:hypothetical protein
MTARIQNAGLARITTALVALSWWLQWGTGSAAVASANDVAAQASEARVLATSALGTTTVTNDTLVLTGLITATAPHAITEVGGFDAATSGNLGLYSDFAVINLNTGDGIAFTLNLRFG